MTVAGRAAPKARARRWLPASLLVGAFVTSGAASAQQAEPLEIEESDVVTLGQASDKWLFSTSQWQNPVTRVIDGASGKLLGMVHQAKLSNFAADPAGKYFYVAETMWTKGNRGVRQDMITVRDSRTLDVVKEIPLSGRLLVGFRGNNFGISADGRYGYVFNMEPAASINVVDFKTGKQVSTVETPGCALAIALPGTRVMSLCNEGTISVTSFDARMKAKTQASPVFFSAEHDPIFDSSVVNRTTGEATLLSYTGRIVSAKLAQGIELSEAWSIQQAAGLPVGSSEPIQINWYPGGRAPIAVHRASNRAFVLMHIGEYWSQKEAGTEVWVLDLAARKLISRRRLEKDSSASQVAVSQGDDPLLFLTGDSGTLTILDARTFEQKHQLKRMGNGGSLQTGLGQ